MFKPNTGEDNDEQDVLKDFIHWSAYSGIYYAGIIYSFKYPLFQQALKVQSANTLNVNKNAIYEDPN